MRFPGSFPASPTSPRRETAPSQRRGRAYAQRHPNVEFPPGPLSLPTSEESRIRLGPFLESYTVGSFGASFFGTCTYLWLGAGGSARSGQYSQTLS